MTSRSGQARTRSGFTLLELMIVLLIIAGILAVALPALLNSQKRANVRITGNQIKIFEQGLKDYFVDNASYPTTEQGLASLWAQPQASAIAAGGMSPMGGMGGTATSMPMGGPGTGGTMDPMGGMGGTMDPMGGMGGAMDPMGGMGGAMDPMGGMGGTMDPMGGMGGMMDPMMGGMGGMPTTMTTPAAASGGNVQNWSGPYLEGDTVPADPWGNAYVYEYPSMLRTQDFPAIYSAGPDKQIGNEDDIRNWDPTKEGRATGAGTGTMTNPMNPMGTVDPMNPMGGGVDPMNPMGGIDPMNPMGGGVDPMNPMGGGIDPMNPMGGGIDPMNPMGGGIDPMNPMGGGIDPMNPMGGGVDPMNPMGGVVDPMNPMGGLPTP